MNLEKFLYKKIPLWILLLTIILSIIISILFGSLVLKSTTAKNIALIPNLLGKIFDEVHNDFLADNRFVKEDKFKKFSTKNEDLSGYLLLSRYDYKKKRSIVELPNIRSGKILHVWTPDINKINSFSKLPKHFNLKRDHNVARYRMVHPYLLDNGDLIIKSTSSPMIKISVCSKMKWFTDKAFHHSTELDFEGNIWAPGFNYPPTIKGIDIDLNRRDGKIFAEDTIEKISQNGKILFSKPLLQILIDNKITHVLPHGWAVFNEINHDLLHLNDVQPVLSDSKYWKKDDIFLSLKHVSLIILYRPSTNKIIWYKQGPWTMQHDVDVINDHQIAIFDNNLNEFSQVDGYSETLIYDFEKNKTFSPYEIGYKNNIRTTGEGLSEILENGDIFVEETYSGRILRMDKAGNIKWQFINKAENDKIYLLNWSRFLNENLYSTVVKKISNMKCNEK